MREILFRGKSVDTGKWVYGYLAVVESYLTDGEFVSIIIPTDAKLYPHCEVESYEVITGTVGQFTGLVDKNGVKIFEGDIVRAMMDWGPAGMIESVVDIGFKKYDGYRWNYFDLSTIEVIGNVCDNPELLERRYDEGDTF